MHFVEATKRVALLNFVPQSFAQLGTSHAQLLSISTPLKLQQVPKRQL
jgi:hypothetical protein